MMPEGTRGLRQSNSPMNHRISIEGAGAATYRVTIEDGKSRTVHLVHADARQLERYGPGVAAEKLLRASFEFLLERESKESILAEFELSEIERYFPDYPEKLGRRL